MKRFRWRPRVGQSKVVAGAQCGCLAVLGAGLWMAWEPLGLVVPALFALVILEGASGGKER